MIPEHEKYAMDIRWSDEDQVYIVTVPELDGCKTHGRTYEDAAHQGRDMIELWLESLTARGLPVPPPRVYADVPG